MWNKNKKIKEYGVRNICNGPLNPKFHILFATFTWKSNMNTFPTLLLQGEIFEDINF